MRLRASHFEFVVLAAVFIGCLGPTREPQPLTPGSPAARTRLVMTQSYLIGMSASHYHLPYGVYPADGHDSRGVYYRAPTPIKVSGLAVALGSGELVQGGIYVPGSSAGRSVGLWFYLIDDDGRISADPIPGFLSWEEGTKWWVETVDSEDDPAA